MLYTAKTDVGKVRTHNEDSVYAAREAAYELYAVADGMGGHQGGETASKMAIDGLSNLVGEYAPQMRDDGLLLRRAVGETNRNIYQQASREPGLYGMGTTLTCAFLRGGILTIAHVGDSRAYMLRKGVFVQLTQDHSYVAELVRMGQLTAQEARTHPQRNIIIRALGLESSVRADIETVQIRAQDMFLLCSDGLTNHVGDEQMRQVLLSEGTLAAKADRLIDMAIEGGGSDNISVVLLKAQEGESA